MVYNGYYKVMSNISKMGHLPTSESPFFLSRLPAQLRAQVGSFTMSGGGGMPPQIRSMISALTGQREDWAKASANVGETTGKDRGEAIT